MQHVARPPLSHFFEAFSILARDRVDRMLYDPNQDLRITWFRGLPP
jgi:hypothetical protein